MIEAFKTAAKEAFHSLEASGTQKSEQKIAKIKTSKHMDLTEPCKEKDQTISSIEKAAQRASTQWIKWTQPPQIGTFVKISKFWELRKYTEHTQSTTTIQVAQGYFFKYFAYVSADSRVMSLLTWVWDLYPYNHMSLVPTDWDVLDCNYDLYGRRKNPCVWKKKEPNLLVLCDLAVVKPYFYT